VKNPLDFSGKVVLVTGAASGVGLVARTVAERVNAVNPGLIDTHIGRAVVEGDEDAYREMEKQVPMGRPDSSRLGSRRGDGLQYWNLGPGLSQLT